MSITGAMSNALSGLSAARQQAGLASTNIANAATPGFGRREIELAARTVAGGGVEVAGVTRVMDRTALEDRRAADAAGAGARAQLDLLEQVAATVGEPGSGDALTDRFAALEAALVTAAERPDSVGRLQAAVEDAARLAEGIGEAARTVQEARGRADAAIADTVRGLNDDLARVARLNEDIRRATVAGEPPSALVDSRQRVIDRIAEQVAVREIPRENGVVALMSRGTLLLDGPAPRIGFTAANTMAPGLSYSAGTLSGLTLNGQPVDIDRPRHALSGGALDGLIAARDRIAPALQADLDALARDLAERFEATGVDPTRGPLDPGLFTDSGALVDPASELGLAQRLSVNVAVDPAQGGEAWRLRDGIYAAAPGAAGDARGLERLAEALSARRTPASGSFAAVPHAAAELAGELRSSIGRAALQAEADATRAGTRAEALAQELRTDGVDTDAEMQKLLQVEQAYAANARVISTLETMLDTLLEI